MWLNLDEAFVPVEVLFLCGLCNNTIISDSVFFVYVYHECIYNASAVSFCDVDVIKINWLSF